MDLRNVSLENYRIIDYLLHIQTLVDSLTSIGDSVSQSEHVNIILEGHPTKYESTIAFIYNKSKLMPIVSDGSRKYFVGAKYNLIFSQTKDSINSTKRVLEKLKIIKTKMIK